MKSESVHEYVWNIKKNNIRCGSRPHKIIKHLKFGLEISLHFRF